jgi:hypothetical protein
MIKYHFRGIKMNREAIEAAAERPLKVNLKDGRIPSEHEEQRAFVEWFRKSFKGVRVFAIPNGGARFKVEAVKLKTEGVSAGVPDLFIPEFNVWIEFKRRKGGVVSKEQKDWHEYLQGIGHNVFVCEGADQAKYGVLDFFIGYHEHFKSLEDAKAL